MYFVPELSDDRQGPVSVKREEQTASTLLSYFVEDESLICSMFFAIADSNGSILRAIDRCYDGAFTDDVECMRLLAKHSVIVHRLMTNIADNPMSSGVSRSAKALGRLRKNSPTGETGAQRHAQVVDSAFSEC
jgi:hypothetical protein